MGVFYALEQLLFFNLISTLCRQVHVVFHSLPLLNIHLHYNCQYTSLTAVSGAGSSPALATCETSQVLLAGVPGGFSRGSPVFAHLLISVAFILKGQ